MFEHHIFTNFVYLVVVINPISLVPEFLYITKHETPESRRRTAPRATLIAAAMLIAFIIIGQILLEALGITLPSFSIAGGLALLAISLTTIFESVHEPVGLAEKAADGVDKATGGSLAVFPLATPVLAGPGGILIVVLLTDNNRFSVPEQAVTALALLVVMALTYVALRAAEVIQRIMGKDGVNVTSRIMGLVYAALSVEIVLNGIRETF